MKRIIYYLLALALVSCYGDKGNDSRTPINEVEIEFDKTSYSVVAKEHLTITPKLTTTMGNEDDFSYVWAVSKSYAPDDQVEVEVDTIARTRNLDWQAPPSANGRQFLYYSVRNDRTGVTYYHKVDVQVVTRYARGFYILKQTPAGDTDLDFFAVDPATGEITSDPGVLTANNGQPLPGRPASFGLSPQYGYMLPDGTYTHTRSLNVATDQKQMVVLSTVDMAPIYDHATMFYRTESPDEQPIYLCSQLFGLCYVSDLGVYFSNQIPDWGMPGSGKFGYPGLEVGTVKPNPNVCMFSTYGNLILFDELGGRLIAYDVSGTANLFGDNTPEGEDPPAALPTGITRKLLYNGVNAIGFDYSGVMIFADPADPAQRYLYRMRYDMYDNPIREIRTLAKGSEIATATQYAINEREALVLYYISGGKLWMYDVGGGTQTQLTPEGIGAGETITYVSNRWYSFEPEYAFNHLVVGTVEGGNYKVRLYNTVGPTPAGAPVRTFAGTGKPFSLHYVSEGMDSFDAIGQYSYGMR